MKYNHRYILILLLVSITYISGCGSDKLEKETKSLNSVIEKLSAGGKSESPIMYYLIIPNAGCTGCISNAEKFTLSNHSKYKILRIIFTGFQSKKMLKLKLGNEVINGSSVWLDTHQECYKAGLSSIYPILYKVVEGKVTEVHVIEPNNPIDVLENLVFELASL